MKVTLNSTVQEGNRAKAEEIVRQMAPGAEIVWLPSRFPRIVMLVEPGKGRSSEPEKGSFFTQGSTAAESGDVLTPAATRQLEEKLQKLL